MTVLNPEAIGNPDMTPVLQVPPDVIEWLNPCKGWVPRDHDEDEGTCNGVNGFHRTVCPIAIEALLRAPLANGRQWSIQGLGMLRTYLSDDESVRLHIWDTQTRQAWNERGQEPSTIHDHPWDFTSTVISGSVKNVRWTKPSTRQVDSELLYVADIRCGVGGGLVSKPDQRRMVRGIDEVYGPGATYKQRAEEMHESFPADGTVTVIERTFRDDTRDLARVAWREGDWVTAEPRPATEDEVTCFTQLAVARWAPLR